MSDCDNSYFFCKVLDGIGYGRLSRTNRAYNWMKSNNAKGGKCLKFLKDNINDVNLVTVAEMNSFINVQKRSRTLSESEIDKELAAFLNDAEIDLRYIHLPATQSENSKALKFHEIIEFEEKILKRLCSDFRRELTVLEYQKKLNCRRQDNVFVSAAHTNTVNNSISEKLQTQLSKITKTFSAELHDSVVAGERNLFRINLTTLKNINITFCEVVNVTIQQRFRNNSSPVEYKTMDECSTSIPLDEALANFILSVGLLNYQKLKLRCEVMELEDLKVYVKNIAKKLDFRNDDLFHFRFSTNEDMEITDHNQRKIEKLTEVMEKFHKDHIVKKMLILYQKEIKRKIKSASKFLPKIFECSANFVDLMALKACLLHKEKNYLSTAVAACAIGKKKLKQRTEKYLTTSSNFWKVSVDQKTSEILDLANPSLSQSMMSALKNYEPIILLRNRIICFVCDCLKNSTVLKEQFKRSNTIIFCGPTGQMFFYSGLRNDEIIIKQKYNLHNERYKSWKAQYYEEAEKKPVAEFSRPEKSFGLMFLTNAADLRSHLEQLRITILRNKSKSSRTITTAPTGSDFSQLGSRKENISSII